jgi:hypothetical protein
MMTLPWLTENRNRSHAHEFKLGWKVSIAYLIQQAFIRQLRAYWCHHVHLNEIKLEQIRKNIIHQKSITPDITVKCIT